MGAGVEHEISDNVAISACEKDTLVEGGHGSGWNVLALVLHNQVSQENLGWSDEAHCMTGAPIEGLANEQQFVKAFVFWMTMLIIDPGVGNVINKQTPGATTRIGWCFPHWSDLMLWAQDVRQSLSYTQCDRQNPFVERGRSCSWACTVWRLRSQGTSAGGMTNCV